MWNLLHLYGHTIDLLSWSTERVYLKKKNPRTTEKCLKITWCYRGRFETKNQECCKYRTLGFCLIKHTWSQYNKKNQKTKCCHCLKKGTVASRKDPKSWCMWYLQHTWDLEERRAWQPRLPGGRHAPAWQKWDWTGRWVVSNQSPSTVRKGWQTTDRKTRQKSEDKWECGWQKVKLQELLAKPLE